MFSENDLGLARFSLYTKHYNENPSLDDTVANSVKHKQPQRFGQKPPTRKLFDYRYIHDNIT